MAPDELEGMIAAQLVGTSDRIRGDHAAECDRRIAAANVSVPGRRNRWAEPLRGLVLRHRHHGAVSVLLGWRSSSRIVK